MPLSQVKLAGNNGLAKEVKADLSRTHFTLGNHKFDWQTDAMRTQVSLLFFPITADTFRETAFAISFSCSLPVDQFLLEFCSGRDHVFSYNPHIFPRGRHCPNCAFHFRFVDGVFDTDGKVGVCACPRLKTRAERSTCGASLRTECNAPDDKQRKECHFGTPAEPRPGSGQQRFPSAPRPSCTVFL